MKDLFLLTFVLISLANTQSDRIVSLPLYDGPLGNQFSGYKIVNASTGRNFHYWFVEAATDPATKPLVLWLNGGPGCSSLDGLFYEHGPLHFAQSDNLTLVSNPYSWHLVANMLYLESPAGVGFSYSSSESDYEGQNDDRTATDNYTFLKKWLADNPQYMKNPFYISGESYAGVYVPSLAKRVLDGVLDNSFVIPFKGILVGNGVANSVGVTDLNSYIPFLYGHGIINTNLFNSITAACNDPNSAQCQLLLNRAYSHMNDIDIYDVYGECYHQRPMESRDNLIMLRSRAGGVPPCIDANYGTKYLNLPEVKNAIHVNTAIDWQICNDRVNEGYQRTSDSMVPIHKYLVSHNIRVLIYSGDTDFAVPYTDSEYWTSNEMGLKVVGTEWRQWYYNDDEGEQVAGFVTDYQGGFSFATVRGAGHMVPQTRPPAAFAMVQRFVNGQPL